MQIERGAILATVVITLFVVTHCRDCHFMDIRNFASSLKKLEGCTAILGFLGIMLIERNTPEDFEKYSFPELRFLSTELM